MGQSPVRNVFWFGGVGEAIAAVTSLFPCHCSLTLLALPLEVGLDLDRFASHV